MNLDQYRIAVEALAREDADRRFSNKGSPHAAIVVEQMFRSAKSSVRIFSGALSPDIYMQQGVQDGVREFMKRDGTVLQVITERQVNAETAAFLHEFGSRVALCGVGSGKTGPLDQHFMVADGKAYRLEIDENSREAIANFKEPRVAASLNAMFDRALAGITKTA